METLPILQHKFPEIPVSQWLPSNKENDGLLLKFMRKLPAMRDSLHLDIYQNFFSHSSCKCGKPSYVLPREYLDLDIF